GGALCAAGVAVAGEVPGDVIADAPVDVQGRVHVPACGDLPRAGPTSEEVEFVLRMLVERGDVGDVRARFEVPLHDGPPSIEHGGGDRGPRGGLVLALAGGGGDDVGCSLAVAVVLSQHVLSRRRALRLEHGTGLGGGDADAGADAHHQSHPNALVV